MTLESLGSFFSSDKSKRSLQRTEQAFRIAGQIKERWGIGAPRVVIRDGSVLIEAPSAAVAQKLLLNRTAIEKIVAEALGAPRRLMFRVRRTG